MSYGKDPTRFCRLHGPHFGTCPGCEPPNEETRAAAEAFLDVWGEEVAPGPAAPPGRALREEIRCPLCSGKGEVSYSTADGLKWRPCVCGALAAHPEAPPHPRATDDLLYRETYHCPACGYPGDGVTMLEHLKARHREAPPSPPAEIAPDLTAKLGELLKRGGFTVEIDPPAPAAPDVDLGDPIASFLHLADIGFGVRLSREKTQALASAVRSLVAEAIREGIDAVENVAANASLTLIPAAASKRKDEWARNEINVYASHRIARLRALTPAGLGAADESKEADYE